MSFHFPESLPQGAVLDGAYRVERLLGTGGMADVYLGHKLDLDIPCAIKILKPINNADKRDRFQKRFLTEAQSAARINHPNVVRILSFHDQMRLQLPDGQEAVFPRPFLVMERLEGDDLETEIARLGPLRPERAWRLIRNALAGLARGHELGIVHKDLKPSNLFLLPARGPGEPETLKVLDFGIARTEDEDETALTRTGETWCTPNYAAPEYIEERTVSPALDVYQMGLVLTELLTGTPVVNEETAFRCFKTHVTGVELPQALLDSPLGPVVQKAVHLDATQRFANAGEFHEALSQIDERAIAAMPLLASPSVASAGAETGEGDLGTFETMGADQELRQTMLQGAASGPALLDDNAVSATVATPPAKADPQSAVPAKADPQSAAPAKADPQSAKPADAAEPADNAATTPPSRGFPFLPLALLTLGVLVVVLAWQLSKTDTGASSDLSQQAPANHTGPDMSGSGQSADAQTAAGPDMTGTSRADTSRVVANTAPCGDGETPVGRICVPDDMAFVSAGTFWLGCERSDTECADHERPGREVTMSAFLLDDAEVTVAQYRQCVDAGTCSAPISEGDHYTWPLDADAQLPVNGVTWAQANQYCQFAGKQLPTEAQWEAAARGNGVRRYPWGNDNVGPGSPAVANLADETGGAAFGWSGFVLGYDDGAAGPASVRAFPAVSGIHSMGGNVREWVADCYAADAYRATPAQDPVVAHREGCGEHIVRGGYFGAFSPDNLRSSARTARKAEHARYDIGFRCARAIP